MIERLLEADRLLALGLTDQAERIYWQAVETDPRNAIAVVGLARVASERGDDRTALEFARKARDIDPENPAAIRLTARLEEIIATREESVQAEAAEATEAAAGPASVQAAAAEGSAQARPAEGTEAAAEPARAPEPTSSRAAPTGPAPGPVPEKRRGLLGRLLGGR